MSRSTLDYLILDAVADDVESFAHIGDRAAAAGLPETTEVLASLRRLTQERLVEACTVSGDRPELVAAGEGVWPHGNATDMWFRITSRGKMVHETWASDGEGAA